MCLCWDLIQHSNHESSLIGGRDCQTDWASLSFIDQLLKFLLFDSLLRVQGPHFEYQELWQSQTKDFNLFSWSWGSANCNWLAFASLGGLGDSKGRSVSSEVSGVAHITYVETSVLLDKELLPLVTPEPLVLSSSEQANKLSKERERTNRNRRQKTWLLEECAAKGETTAFPFHVKDHL